MGNFIAGLIIGAIIMGFVTYQVGIVHGRKAMKAELKREKRA